MPLYEYECRNCGNRFERIQKFSDPPVDVCPNCGAKAVEKLLSSPAIQFKGSGWYITDYARKGGAGSDTASKPASPAEAKSGGSDSAAPAAPSPAPSTPSKPSGD